MNPQSCCKALLWIYHSLLYDRGSDPRHGSEEHFVLFSVGFGYPTWSVLCEHYCVALDVSSLLHMVLGANLTDLSDTLFESELCERSPKQPLSIHSSEVPTHPSGFFSIDPIQHRKQGRS